MALLLKTCAEKSTLWAFPCMFFLLLLLIFFLFSLLLSDGIFGGRAASCLVQRHSNPSLSGLGVLCSCDKMAQGQLPQQGSACLVRIYILAPRMVRLLVR